MSAVNTATHAYAAGSAMPYSTAQPSVSAFAPQGPAPVSVNSNIVVQSAVSTPVSSTPNTSQPSPQVPQNPRPIYQSSYMTPSNGVSYASVPSTSVISYPSSSNQMAVMGNTAATSFIQQHPQQRSMYVPVASHQMSAYQMSGYMSNPSMATTNSVAPTHQTAPATSLPAPSPVSHSLQAVAAPASNQNQTAAYPTNTPTNQGPNTTYPTSYGYVTYYPYQNASAAAAYYAQSYSPFYYRKSADATQKKTEENIKQETKLDADVPEKPKKKRSDYKRRKKTKGEDAEGGKTEEAVDDVLCVCKTMYDPDKFYIQCDKCDSWFHGTCMSLREDDAGFLEKWYCRDCRSKYELSNIWKKKCARRGCRKALSAEKEGSAKYCSEKCAYTMAEERVAAILDEEWALETFAGI